MRAVGLLGALVEEAGTTADRQCPLSFHIKCKSALLVTVTQAARTNVHFNGIGIPRTLRIRTFWSKLNCSIVMLLAHAVFTLRVRTALCISTA